MTMALANKENDTIPQNRLDMKADNTKHKPDLTEAETAFLRALLLDPIKQGASSSRTASTTKTLDDEILFSLPFHQETLEKQKSSRRNTILLGLWHAFEDGVQPKTLVRQASMHRQKSKAKRLEKQRSIQNQESQLVDDESYCSAKSDEEVRAEKRDVKEDELSSCSSWGEDDGGHEHYDSWEVLKDEYAGDFGFDYSEPLSVDFDDMDDQGHVFKILGTSANDAAAHPHVLSPPLMDALMSFMPESLENQNFWLKYSLVRDGSSMNTLKHYVRASSNTILAIETTTGEVFGAFTTSPWRTQFGFFGEGKGSFLWRMRHNRQSPCHSLFEQAQLETEIDVYEYSGLNKLIQHCSHNEIAIGGGNILEHNDIDSDDDVSSTSSPIDRIPSPLAELQQLEDTIGFGIAIDEFLARGTTSPCATFRNPSLMNKLAETETFQIANLEVWTLTPGYNVKGAEKLEMTKYFADQSSHNSESVHSIYSDIAGSYTGGSSSPLNSMTAADAVQASFYRRVGENDQSEEQRQRWQYANMMGMM